MAALVPFVMSALISRSWRTAETAKVSGNAVHELHDHYLNDQRYRSYPGCLDAFEANCLPAATQVMQDFDSCGSGYKGASTERNNAYGRG